MIVVCVPRNSAGHRELCVCRLLTRGLVSSRGLVGGRPNGISEMPDPEAAEYLAEHQSGDLGSDILTAAKLHYNGTQEGAVHPLSTDRHATIEEHITQVATASPSRCRQMTCPGQQLQGAAC